MYLFLIKGLFAAVYLYCLDIELEVSVEKKNRAMSTYTEFRSSICLDCCRNAYKLLHSLQDWDEIQIRSRFHPRVRVESEVVASPTTHFSLLNVTILSFRRDNYLLRDVSVARVMH